MYFNYVEYDQMEIENEFSHECSSAARSCQPMPCTSAAHNASNRQLCYSNFPSSPNSHNVSLQNVYEILLDFYPELDDLDLEISFLNEIENDLFIDQHPPQIQHCISPVDNVDINNNVADISNQGTPQIQHCILPVDNVDINNNAANVLNQPLNENSVVDDEVEGYLLVGAVDDQVPERVDPNMFIVYDRMLNTFQGEHYLGELSNECSFCKALLFRDEITSVTNGRFELCCKKGKVGVSVLDDYPEDLKELFNAMESEQYVHFIKNIRAYNNSVAMGSVDVHFPILAGRGIQPVVVQGQIYHRISPLQPSAGRQRAFGQLYVLDPDEAATLCCSFSSLRYHIVALLSHFFHSHNLLARSYIMMGNILRREEERAAVEGIRPPEFRMSFIQTADLDLRRYNSPVVNEIAIVYRHVEGENDNISSRTLTVYNRGGGLMRISELDKHCDPLTYPLFYPYGRGGWHPQYHNSSHICPSHRVSQREYYAFLLFHRHAFIVFLKSSKLFAQFMIDGYIKVENSRLNFFKNSRKKFRLLTAEELEDSVFFDECPEIGQPLHLPSSFVGGPTYIHKSYQDAVRMMGRHGKPDFFITMTANPNWREIQENLYARQTASDRPDLVARVFRQKWKELKADIMQKKIFGEVACFISVF